MITKEQVINLIEAKIAGTDMFIVEVNVRPGNVIEVTMDGDKGITIEACTEIHRHILHEMDREVEDYSLEVSSPDLMKPLKVLRQFKKNLGRTVSVKLNDKSKVEGELRGADESGITVFTSVKEVIPGTKKKALVEKESLIPFTEIAETKIVISFK
jgi:ribosome maturation factor RimP